MSRIKKPAPVGAPAGDAWTSDEISLVKDVAAAVVTEITVRGDHRSTPQSAVSRQPNGG